MPTLNFDTDELRPLIREVVREVLAELDGRAAANGRAAMLEADAADYLGVRAHVLRDARRRGEVAARKLGRRWVYRRADLERMLAGEAETQTRRGK